MQALFARKPYELWWYWLNDSFKSNNDTDYLFKDCYKDFRSELLEFANKRSWGIVGNLLYLCFVFLCFCIYVWIFLSYLSLRLKLALSFGTVLYILISSILVVFYLILIESLGVERDLSMQRIAAFLGRIYIVILIIYTFIMCFNVIN
jgi:Mn2+/Fe2+ NRAMP family transporter